jgi:hypothetical protein
MAAIDSTATRRAKREKATAKKATATATKAAAPKATARVKDPKAIAVNARAKEIAPMIKSGYNVASTRSLINIVGRRDPITFPKVTKEALAGRDPKAVLTAWARDELPKDDEAAKQLRAFARELSKDPRGNNLWGRRIAALLVAMKEVR